MGTDQEQSSPEVDLNGYVDDIKRQGLCHKADITTHDDYNDYEKAVDDFVFEASKDFQT